MPEEQLPTEDFMTRWARERAEAFTKAKEQATPTIEKLVADGYKHIHISYDGVGDSGSIESIAITKADISEDGDGDFQNYFSNDGHWVEHDEPGYDGPLKNLGYCALEQSHAGWENNEGAYGLIKIDLAKRKITVDHNQRVEEVIPSTDEMDL